MSPNSNETFALPTGSLVKSAISESLAEKPLLDPNDDVLGYSRFAKDLASALSRIDPSDGLVLALNGAWGAGKSTLINFVISYLAQSKDELEQPTVIRFNPWWFSGQDELARIFFEELLNKLQNPSLTQQALDALKTVAPLLRILGKAVSKLPPTITGGLLPTGSMGDAVTQIGDELNKLGVKTLAEAKKSVEDLLKLVSTRILVVIDDIDRLTADEVRQTFRLVKAIANFPNITYLLAFDRRVISAALGTEQVSGEDYLAKIVQITFDLPPADQTSLRYLLEDRLRKLLIHTSPELFTRERWPRAYMDGSEADGIRHFLRTPRDVVRLTNHLSLTYRIVQNEVNAVDFIIMETLRIFCPAVYQFVRSNPDAFCLGKSAGSGGQPHGRPPASQLFLRPGRLKEIYEPTLRRLLETGTINENDIRSINQLLKQIFPNVAFALTESISPNRPPDQQNVVVQAKGISDAEYFPRYFRLSPPEGGISRGDALVSLSNTEAFRQQLLERSAKHRKKQPTDFWMERPNRTDELLDWLSRNTHEVPEDLAANAFRTLFEVLQSLPTGQLPAALLSRVPEGQRLGLLEEMTRNTSNLEALVMLVEMVGNAHHQSHMIGSPFPLSPLLDQKSQTNLQEMAARKMQEAAADGTIWDVQQLRRLLGCWYAWGDRKELASWGKKAVEKDLAKFLDRFVEPIFEPPGPPQMPQFQPDWLRFFIDPADLVERAKSLLQGEQSLRVKSAVTALCRVYEEQQKRQIAENPFDSFAVRA